MSGTVTVLAEAEDFAILNEDESEFAVESGETLLQEGAITVMNKAVGTDFIVPLQAAGKTPPAWRRGKDPDEVVDYSLDWSRHFSGLVIASSSWAVPDGLTAADNGFRATSSWVRLAGGEDGKTYEMTNTVIVEDGQVLQQTIRLAIRSR